MAYLEVFDDAPPPHGRGRRQFLAWLEVRKRPLEDVWYVEVIAAEVYWRQGHVVIGYGLPNRPTTTPTATPAPPTTAPSASGMWTVPLARFAPRKARPRPRARNASARDRRQREN